MRNRRSIRIIEDTVDKNTHKKTNTPLAMNTDLSKAMAVRKRSPRRKQVIQPINSNLIDW